jgi:hypothetical protein
MALLIPIIAMFAIAFAASLVTTRLHHRATPGGPLAVATGVLLDRRFQRLLAALALVALVIALAVA